MANVARTVQGPQISVVNIADSVYRRAGGCVNIARHVSGVQVGVVNISQEIDGVPVGVVSIEGRGRHALDLWVDMDGVPYGAISLGTRHLYSVFSAGWRPGTTPTLWSLGAGPWRRADWAGFLDLDSPWCPSARGPRGGLPRFSAPCILGCGPSPGTPSWTGSRWWPVCRFGPSCPASHRRCRGATRPGRSYQPSFIVGIHLGEAITQN